MPRPPPPADALTSTGKPISLGKPYRVALVVDQAVAAGHTGTLASRASCRAEFLSPSRAMACGVGPMKSILQLRQTSLKWAFSERKP